MRILYPLTVKVDGMVRRQSHSDYSMEGQGWRRWWSDYNRDLDYYAPRWIAWLYQWLPVSVVWLNKPEHRKCHEGAWFLWQVLAPRWGVGWLPAARIAYRDDPSPPRWGELVYGFGPKQRIRI